MSGQAVVTPLADGLCRMLEVLIVAALALMVLLVFGNVVLRYGFNSGITVSEEVSRWLFIWGTFLGAVVGLRERAHLGVDFVVQWMGRGGRRLCAVAGHLLMIAITLLLARGSWDQVKINWDVTAPTTGASMAIVYLAGLVFAALALPMLLLDFVRIVRNRMSDEELVMVRESEEAEQLEQALAEANRPGMAPAAGEAESPMRGAEDPNRTAGPRR